MNAIIHYKFILFFIALFAVSCDSVSTSSETDNKDSDGNSWLIPESQIFVGAGRDEIPSIDNPSFKPVNEITFLDEDELILGIKIDGVIKGYPHQILNYHEIINDRIADTPIAITFCPLTGSGMAWDRVVNGRETTFGVSGLIHKNNLIAYDRATDNFWSQMLEMSVNGSLQSEKTNSYTIVEMNWSAWKKAFPKSMVLSGETGFDRNYRVYPYGRDYNQKNDFLLFPVHLEDDRLERKTLLHGIFYETNLHVFPIEYFPEEFKILNRNISGNEVVIAGSSKDEMAVSYSRVADDGNVLLFFESEKELPILMKDNEGNEWDLFGECVSGERKGEKLNRLPSYNAYWFAWVDFFGQPPKLPIIVSP
ncbi:MAG: DUF3179 domain-containing protein [Balneolaceae bacterium]